MLYRLAITDAYDIFCHEFISLRFGLGVVRHLVDQARRDLRFRCKRITTNDRMNDRLKGVGLYGFVYSSTWEGGTTFRKGW
jgi:hypothetical protein